MALVLILLAYAKIILEEDECQTEDNGLLAMSKQTLILGFCLFLVF